MSEGLLAINWWKLLAMRGQGRTQIALIAVATAAALGCQSYTSTTVAKLFLSEHPAEGC
jgi:hypothetical protein